VESKSSGTKNRKRPKLAEVTVRKAIRSAIEKGYMAQVQVTQRGNGFRSSQAMPRINLHTLVLNAVRTDNLLALVLGHLPTTTYYLHQYTEYTDAFH